MDARERKRRQEEDRKRKNAEVLRSYRLDKAKCPPARVKTDGRLVERVFGKQPPKARSQAYSDLIDREVAQFKLQGPRAQRSDVEYAAHVRQLNRDELELFLIRLRAAGVEVV
jgi:hypothetical protein